MFVFYDIREESVIEKKVILFIIFEYLQIILVVMDAVCSGEDMTRGHQGASTLPPDIGAASIPQQGHPGERTYQ